MPLLPHLQLTATLNTATTSHLLPHCPICLDLAHRPHQLCPYLLKMWELDAELQELQKARIMPLSVRPLISRPLSKVPSMRDKRPTSSDSGRTPLFKKTQAALRARQLHRHPLLQRKIPRLPTPPPPSTLGTLDPLGWITPGVPPPSLLRTEDTNSTSPPSSDSDIPLSDPQSGEAMGMGSWTTVRISSAPL